MKKSKRLTAILLCCMLLVGQMLVITASAARKINLTVDYKYEDLPLSQAQFDIYKIATVNGNGEIKPISPFSYYALDFSKTDNETMHSLALTMASYIARDGIKPYDSAVTDADGKETRQLIHQFHHHKYAQCEDSEIDYLLNKRAIVPRYGRGHNSTRRIQNLLFERQFQIGKISTTHEQTDWRHNDIVHERGNNLTKRATDDNTDSHINHISFKGKCLKLFQKSHNFLSVFF